MKIPVKEKNPLKDFLLAKTLLGIDPDSKLKWIPEEPTPERESCIFVKNGHFVEYLMVGPEAKRLVSLFYGPGEFIVPCHPLFSILQSIDDSATATFTYSMVIRTLRTFPETYAHYRKVREEYLKKVNRRLLVLTAMTVEERYNDLKEQQPWVLSLAMEEDIASYLGVTTEILKRLRK